MKRFFDIAIAIVILVIGAIPLLAIYCLVRLKLGRGVFFRQTRPGLHGRPFEMIKFRSMTDDVGRDGKPLPDAERLTKFGKFLRSSSLDELPEMWNVIKGEMSLVGPRPLLMEYIPLYTEEQMKRHQVRPGITGWAQVNGRNALSWDEKFALDIWYVENRSFWLDMKILGLTIKKVGVREGISAAGEATMVKFTGTRL